MLCKNEVLSLAILLTLTTLFPPQQSLAQNSSNPYQIVEGWAKLPGGRLMGAVGKAEVDIDAC